MNRADLFFTVQSWRKVIFFLNTEKFKFKDYHNFFKYGEAFISL